MPPRRNDPNWKRKRRATARRLGVTTDRADFKWLCGRKQDRVSIVAEGDSWFSYPPKSLVFGKKSNAMDHIHGFTRVDGQPHANILRLEASGDEAVEMTDPEKSQFQALRRTLRDCKPDLLLFSGGGNDIVGKRDLPPLLRDWSEGASAKECVEGTLFEERLAEIQSAYERILGACEELSPNTFVITHAYDLPQPRDRGAEFFWGLEITQPWLHPYLVKKGIRDATLQREVAEHLLTGFRRTLDALAVTTTQLRVAPTQGTLTPGSEEHWLNEIHPTSEGFRLVARVIYSEMRSVNADLPALQERR